MRLGTAFASLGQTDQRGDWRSWGVAALTAVALAGVVMRLAGSGERVVGIIFVLLLGAITAVEVRTGLIPDALTIPGIVAGLALSFFGVGVSVQSSLFGIVFAGGIVFVIILASGGGVGGGVMKMAAMIGAFLGWNFAGLALLGTTIIAGVFASLLIWRGRRASAPLELGPFLAATAVASLMWGADVLAWYTRLMSWSP